LAVPFEDYTFKKWNIWDAVDPNIVVDDTSNPITIDMVADRKVKAVFKCGGGGGVEQALPLLVVLTTLCLFAWIRRGR
jgi:hypothetical protein